MHHNLTFAATHPLVVDSLYLNSSYKALISATSDPRAYLAELFSSGKNTIHRKSIEVRSDRLIDEYAQRYGYAKRFGISNAYYIPIEADRPIVTPRIRREYDKDEIAAKIQAQRTQSQKWLAELKAVDEMTRAEVMEKYGLSNPSRTAKRMNEKAGRKIIQIGLRGGVGKSRTNQAFYRYIGGSA